MKSSSEEESSDQAINSASHHLVTADGLVHSFKLSPDSSLSQELETHVSENSLNPVSDSYQVLSTVVDSHRVLINHGTIPVSEESAPSLHSTINTNSSELNTTETTSESSKDNNTGNIFTTVEDIASGGELIVMQSSVDHVSATQSLMECANAGNLPRGDNHSSVLEIGTGREEGMLQVVAAADGLASLGTDLTGVITENSSEPTSTFIMAVEGAQQLLVQNEDNASLDPLTEGTGSILESKRPRLS